MGADGKDSMDIRFDRSKLRTVGFKAIDEFLHKLHVYKSIGDFETAEKFFDSYSQVNEKMLKVRQIVIDRRNPRRLELQPNLFMDGEKVFYQGYDVNHAGIVQSYIERWEPEFLEDVYSEWAKYADRFRAAL